MQVDQEMLLELVLAANYMDIKPLLDLGRNMFVNIVKGRILDMARLMIFFWKCFVIHLTH